LRGESGATPISSCAYSLVHEVELLDVCLRESRYSVVSVDQVLLARVDRRDGFTACCERCGAVMHHGGEIIGSPQRIDIPLDVEVEPHTSHNVTHVDSNVLVTVGSRLFVEQTDRVSDFVHGCPFVPATGSERDSIAPSLHADRGRTTPSSVE